MLDLLYIFGIVSKLELVKDNFWILPNQLAVKKLRKTFGCQDYHPLFVSQTWTLKDTDRQKKLYKREMHRWEKFAYTNLSI